MTQTIDFISRGRFVFLACAVFFIATLAAPHARAGVDHEVSAVGSGDYHYDGPTPAAVRIVVEDARKLKSPFVWGRYEKVHLTFAQGGGDPLAFLAESIASELSKHGIPASTKPDSDGETMKLRIETFDIRNRQTTGFSPMVTLTHLRIVATYQGKSQVITGFAVHAKVLKRKRDTETWTYLYSDPLHLVVREAAAKLNRSFWGLSVPDAKVDELIASKAKAGHSAIISRLADIASTNTQRATQYLSTLTADGHQTVRRTALWGLGVLGMKSAVPFLKKAALDGDAANVYLAVKSLSDIGGNEASAAIKEIEKVKRPEMAGREIESLDAVIALYR